MTDYKISPSSVYPDPNNPNLTIPRSYGVWELPVESSNNRYGYGNYPVRGKELKRKHGNAQLIELYTSRQAAKLHADTLKLNTPVATSQCPRRHSNLDSIGSDSATLNFSVSTEKRMPKLNETYMKIREILGNHTEPLESVQLVETYRRYLKPEKVRVVLLAESHVFTTDADRQIEIPLIEDFPGYPTRYAKFVYCLGYGEKELTKSQLHPKRDGTPQFWKIFFSCNTAVDSLQDFRPILSQTPSRQRLQNKIELLKNLKERGIWLVDMSIIALYRGGEKLPRMFKALEKSWQLYTREVITSANPEQVICIGKGVASVVKSDLEKYFPNRFSVISQPNAFLSSEEHMANYKLYHKICCG